MYSLWWPNHIVPTHVSKVVKNMHVLCENIARLHKCLMLWWFEIWENQFNSHNHNYLMGTITFEVHPITPTSLRNTLAIIFKSILILFAWLFFVYFFFWAYHAWAYKREKKCPIMLSQKHHNFVMLKYTDYLIVLITNTSHKTHLLSCALRCSIKLQRIQSLENFVLVAIQGAQVRLYTKYTLFLHFSDFSNFFFFEWKTN